MPRIPGVTAGLLRIFVLHLLLFLVIRLALLVACHNLLDNENSAGDILLMFFNGLRFDTAVLCYTFMPALFLAYLGLGFNKGLFYKITTLYLKISLPVLLFISCSDIPYFVQFQKHLSKEFLTWFSQGSLSFRLIFSDFAYWGYGLLFLPFAYGSVKITSTFRRMQPAPISKVRVLGGFVLFGCLLFAGARGRLSLKSPLHPGLAYFSQNLLINQGGLNANFTLLNSFIYPVADVDVFDPAGEEENLQWVKKSLGINDSLFFERLVKARDTAKKLNVVVVLMESMSRYKTGYLCNKVLAPKLMELADKGIFFNSFYSAGIHTYNGIFSTVTGYPAILHEHMMENYVFKKFSCLPSVLGSNGYNTMFFTSHDEQFDNMGGFLTFNGVEKIYTDKDYPDSVERSAMGIPDHELFDFSTVKMSASSKPFFSLILTSSDHGPWEIPDGIPFAPDRNLPEEERAVQYADWSIGRFMEEARKEKWFDNTLFVFLGDHGGPHGSTYEMDLQFNYIPCVFYSPALISPAIYTGPALQIDVFPTIMGMLGLPYTNRSMGIDLFRESRPYAFFSADDKLGCINSDFFYYRLTGTKGEALYRHNPLTRTDLMSKGRQKADSMRYYMEAMMQSAVYILKNGKY